MEKESSICYNLNMKTEKTKQIFKILTMIFFIISPIFDTVFLYNHLITLLRIGIIAVFLIVTLILYTGIRKKFKYLLAYYLALIIFLVIGYFHSKGFSSLIPGNLNYSLLEETTTIIKLAMPFTIWFIASAIEYTKKDYFRLINGWIILIAGSIVFTNLFTISLSSYSDEVIKYNIFNWSTDIPVSYTASRGFFAYANQATVLISMLLVLNIYEVLFVDKKSFLLLILLVLASLMLGTRLSTIGGFLIVAVTIISYIVYSFIKKRKVEKSLLLVSGILILWAILLPISPNNSRLKEIDEAKNRSEETSYIERQLVFLSTQVKTTEELEDIYRRIDSNLVGEKFYFEYYPAKYDSEFWENIIALQSTGKVNYRFVEKAIAQRLFEIDGRKSDYWFGISNSRIQHAINVEQDFVLHFYAFGIVGAIVTLFFYPFVLFIFSKRSIKMENFIDVVLFLVIVFFILETSLSGNTLNFLAATVPFSLVLAAGKKLKD